MKPKMKKNPEYRRGGKSNKTHRYQSDGDYDDGDVRSVDKKYSNRRERRIFSQGNIARVYRDHIEPRLREEEEEEEELNANRESKEL